MSGRKLAMEITSFQAIPWNKNCDDCAHFAAAPGNVHEQAPFLEAVWNHMYLAHHVEMHGVQNPHDPGPVTYRRIIQ